ncbi:hypothetical protein IAU60_004162 [Kwoniella sp. DSM 27419]
MPRRQTPASDIKRSHRRSRSFSDLASDSRRIATDQPWRSREAWQAYHDSRRPQESLRDELMRTMMPSAMGNGGWRSRGGGGTFFGADMTFPLPGNPRVRVKQVRQVDLLGHDLAERRHQQQSRLRPAESDKRKASLHSHPTRSARDLSGVSEPRVGIAEFETPQGTSKSPQGSDPLPNPIVHESNADDLLPPLLPRTVTRSSSFCSSTGNSTPVPWAKRSATPSPRAKSPTRSPPASSRTSGCKSGAAELFRGSGQLRRSLANPAAPSLSNTAPRDTPSPPTLSPKTPQTPLFPLGESKSRNDADRRSASPTKISPGRELSLDQQYDESVPLKGSVGRKFWKNWLRESPRQPLT